jgi:isopentenyl-diphosphate delta-isomerase
LEIRGLDCKKIASGGLRTGVDIAKSIALGADIAGMALPLLKAYDSGGEKGVEARLSTLIEELKLAMFLTGAADVASLKEKDFRVLGETYRWMQEVR